tara:strand:+ start:161 stop:331 length:171 start_codon:yes stop_codon:yes gene_type:complete
MEIDMTNSHKEWKTALGSLRGGNGGVVIYFSPFGRTDYIKFESFEELTKWEQEGRE